MVCPDLRGYGESTLPPDAPDRSQSSKRAMAHDIARLMTWLEYDRFAVVGHDRGALVAFRTAMDHPAHVSHLIVMDGLPVIEHVERTDARFATAWWHWWFLAQVDKPAERFITADPAAWYSTPPPDAMGAANHADVWAAMRNPTLSMACARTTARAWGSTGSTTKQTADQVDLSRARLYYSNRLATTSTSMVTLRRSGSGGSDYRSNTA